MCIQFTVTSHKSHSNEQVISKVKVKSVFGYSCLKQGNDDEIPRKIFHMSGPIIALIYYIFDLPTLVIGISLGILFGNAFRTDLFSVKDKNSRRQPGLVFCLYRLRIVLLYTPCCSCWGLDRHCQRKDSIAHQRQCSATNPVSYWVTTHSLV